MKKMLLLLNGLQVSRPVVSSAISLAKKDSSLLHAVFLRRLYPVAALQFPLASDLPLMEKENEEDKKLFDENIRRVRHILELSGVQYAISENDISLEDLVNHSAFADLILLDARTSLSGLLYSPLNVSLKDLLVDAHCPVLLLAEESKPAEELILAYDGSYSSIYSIKFFSYLFPEWRSLPAHLVTIHAAGSVQLDYREYIKDWLPLHFDKLELDLLKGKASEELPAFVNRYNGHTIVVMGAYGGTAVSRLFRQSLAKTLLEKTKASLFVTHE